MNRVILVRHAQVSPQPEIPSDLWALSADGQAGAAALASRPDIAAAEAVYTSPELKARLTAEALAGSRRVGVVEDLRELDRRALGWVGSEGAYASIVEEILARPEESVRSCERAADATRRVVAAIGTLAARHPTGTVVAVSHGIVLTLLISAVLGLDRPSASIWRSIRFPDVAVIEPEAGTIVEGFGAAVPGSLPPR